MANLKITELTDLSEAPAMGDKLVIVDVSDTTMSANGTDKDITTANLFGGMNAPEGFLINGKLSVIDAAGITVAIKGMDGNDPSATNPVYCRINGVIRSITAALSVAKADGTNWFNAGSAELATKEIDYFAYLGYNATDGVVIGFSRIPSANSYDDFSTTSTNEKYCAISTITNAAATDYYNVIGRFAATLSAGAGYTWSVPTYTAKNLIQRSIYEGRPATYTPTGPTNTTLTGKYQMIGNRMKVRIKGVLTGTPVWTNMPTLPFTASANMETADYIPCGVGGYLDSGTANGMMQIIPSVGASGTVCLLKSTAGGGGAIAPTVPITWATNDVWFVQFEYEI